MLWTQFVKGRDDRVGVGQKFLPGRAERRILVDFAGGDEMVDLL